MDAAFRATLARIERRCPAFLALPVGQLSRDDLKRAGHHRGSVATLTRNECLWPVARRHRLQPAISCLSLGAAVDTLRPIAEASGKVNVLHPAQPPGLCRVENCRAFSTSGHPGHLA